MSAIRVAFIGLGNMGMPMTKSLAVKGFTLTVYNLVRETVEKMESVGGSHRGILLRKLLELEFIQKIN
jgi:3-hydroxyisobutyrate dehydrogenase-like beta-hydroxyacid dehydrogenase